MSRAVVYIDTWVDKLATLSTMTQGHLQTIWKFAKISRKVSVLIYLYRWAENEIFLKMLLFSNTDIHRFLWLYSLMECLQFSRMYVTSFSFHSKYLTRLIFAEVNFHEINFRVYLFFAWIYFRGWSNFNNFAWINFCGQQNFYLKKLLFIICL